MEEKQKPVHEIRLGRIRAAIWGHNNASGGTEYYTVISRVYKDDEGKWAQSHGYWPEDLPVANKVGEMALIWIWKQKARLATRN
ncbi:MAG: hypothetical protein KDB01_02005 [Planctomycetaceae bacterium]|nr:hypothetical protein [Planctomycetaceae bacterium]